jgi:hypothetical protein
VFAAFAVAVFLFAAGLGWNLPGIGAAADLVSNWFSRAGQSSLLPVISLFFYEPLAVLAGLLGLVCFVRKRRRFGILLGLWSGLGLFVLVAIPPQTPVGGVWVLLPLALLGGFAVETAVKNRGVVKEWRAEWVYAAITGALWVYLYLRFSSYGLQGNPLDLVVGIMALITPLFLLALAAAIFALTSRDDLALGEEITAGAHSALRGAILSTGAVLLAVTFSMGWGVAHVRPADPRELLVHEPTDTEVRDLVQALQHLSWQETGLPMTLAFTYEAPADSVLAWYLRDFSVAQRVDNLRGLESWQLGQSVMVASDRESLPWHAEEEASVDLVGQDFVLSRQWDASNVRCFFEWPPCQQSVEWLIRRDPTATDQSERWLALKPEADQWAVIWTYVGRE